MILRSDAASRPEYMRRSLHSASAARKLPSLDLRMRLMLPVKKESHATANRSGPFGIGGNVVRALVDSSTSKPNLMACLPFSHETLSVNLPDAIGSNGLGPGVPTQLNGEATLEQRSRAGRSRPDSFDPYRM